MQKILGGLVALFLVVHAASAQEDLSGGTFSIYFENDLFTGTDRYYTNGVKLSWTSPDLEKFKEEPRAGWLLPFIDLVPLVNAPKFQRNIGFSLGQNIYTPDNTESNEPVLGDRPYAGWLYLGLSLTRKNDRYLDTFGVNLGVVGPESFAEPAQRLVHETRNLSVPSGWSNQLDTEIGVILTYEHKRRYPIFGRRAGISCEVIPHGGVAAGNVLTYAALGGELRLGFHTPDDFGTAPIGPTTPTPTPVEGAQQEERSRFDFGLYVFGRAEGRYVVHNIFLDGNTFSDSLSVDKKPLVADLSAGVSLNFKNSKLTYAVVYRTEEFYGQNDPQIFGSVTMTFAF